MFAYRAFSSLKQVARLSGISMTRSITAIPKYNYSSAILANVAAQNSIINPNTIQMVNLRELILSTKSETDSVIESI